jgi:acetolactate synthase-1/2/3 large subunit
MPEMTGGQALIKSLTREGVEVIFGLPGVQMYEAINPIADEPGLRFITARHEQATAYMADGYARASGKPGVCMVVPGPGLLNASAAIGSAFAASSPVLVVAGQIPKDNIGKDVGLLHEVNDQMVAIQQVTKAAYRMLDPKEVPITIHEAFKQLRTGRPRPVEVEIPPDTLAEVADIDLLEPGDYGRHSASKDQVDEAARILAQAKDPVIWAGGGVISSGGTEALTRIAEHLQVPVQVTHEGKGAIDERHYLSRGALKTRTDTLREELKKHDVILAVGTRFAAVFPDPAQRVVQIDIDPEELGRNHENTYGVLGDAGETLAALEALLTSTTEPRASRQAEMEEWRKARFSQGRLEPQDGFNEALRRSIPEDGILIAGMTQLGYYGRLYYPVYGPGTYLNSSYFGNLGFAYPTALGVKVAKPDTPVVVISGDGGFMFNSSELATAVQYNINVVLVVFNDNAFGNVMRDQKDRYGENRVVGSQLHNPDFVKLAEAYGARGVRAQTPAALEQAVREAITIDAPTLIEVPVGPMPSPF